MIKTIILASLALLVLSQYTVVAEDKGTTYLKLTLQYTGQDQYYVKPKSRIVKELVFHFQALSYSDFNFRVYDPLNSRFTVPQGGIFPSDPKKDFSFPLSLASYAVTYKSQHFSFQITRKTTGAVLFDSSVVELEFSDLYIQLGTITDSKVLFGFSERFTEHFGLKSGTWTVWNKDNGQKIDRGAVKTGGIQTHGYYPVYLTRQQSGDYHMGYFRTSEAMDVEVEAFSNSSLLKIYRTIGGIIDFRFIVGEKDPEDLINEFHNMMGGAHIPPFWSLGFHQCRWGYHNASVLERVLDQYEQNNVPLDVIWSDIDYMHDFQTFTVDTDNFPLDQMRAIALRYKYVPIIEPSIRNQQGYAYEEGKRRQVFIQAAEGGDLVGKVWAGPTNFVDYFHPNASQYWKDMLQHLHQQIEFAGCWLDMNEISNLCDGPCSPPTGPSLLDYSCDLPYQPGGINVEMATIPLNATHFGNRTEAHTHVFFGLMESYNTFEYLRSIGKRPFVLTRGHTLGSSRFAAHWTGDNYSNFTFLRLSIGGTFMQNMLGVQMVGSDICGFGGNATEELCARFFQLGSLYPFARNHNEFDSVDQEAYSLGPVVLAAAKNNLKLRYSLLKAYYREFLTRKGLGTIFRPLLFEFYGDTNTLREDILETQLLIGRGLMSAPVVEQGALTRSVYFPGDSWFDLQTGEEHKPGSVAIIANSLTDPVPLFLRNGFLTFRQDVQKVTKTQHLDNVFEVVAACKLQANTSTSIEWAAEGGLLSLGDYESVSGVESCIAEDCDYRISLVLKVNKQTNQKLLSITTRWQGKSVRFEQAISYFKLFVQGGQGSTFIPVLKVRIYDQDTKTYSLP